MSSNRPSADYRRILPRPGGGGPPKSNPPNRLQLPKRSITPTACEPCRHYKVKCDGHRPICKNCIARARDCVYRESNAQLRRSYEEFHRSSQELRKSHEDLAELVEALRHSEEADASAILRRIRNGDDVASVLRFLRAGDILLQMHVAPETRYRNVFPYRTNMPARLIDRDNAYLQSPVYELALGSLGPGAQESSSSSPSLSQRQPWSAQHLHHQYLTPNSAATIIDPRLTMVKPSMWTTVSTDDKFMQKLLHLYFLREYSYLACFQKDHFLDDMLSGSTEYCSSLLVNAILAQATNCYSELHDRAEYWNPHSMGYKFFAEAKRLWELELTAEATLTTIQAGQIFNMVYCMHSMDKLGMTYGIQAVGMAEKLKLLGPTYPFKSERKRISYGFTAWCIYSALNLQCYHFRIPPLVNQRPAAALPDPEIHRAWYGELLLQYPASSESCTLSFGHLFKARGMLADIYTDISTALFSKQQPQQEQRGYIAMFIGKLKEWHSSLPTCLSPARILFPCQLKLHLTYHNILINLCEFQLGKQESTADELIKQTQETLSYSTMCYETVLRLYYLRHGFQEADSYLTHPLTVLAFIAVNRLKLAASSVTTPDRSSLEDDRATLLLATKGLGDQSQNYNLPSTLLYVIRQMMSPRDLDLLDAITGLHQKNAEFSPARARYVKAQYPCDISQLTDLPEERRLGNLIKEYADLAIGESKLATAGPDNDESS